ncbi:GDNF family receptor alpha-like isoform X1 [Apteryx mantelli]|uniref:GDNF family receptor alpha-like isoform X1 n=1 Tax=Apteryx mantelli TaxID=2696672 RepID=A0ABM4EC46_9AVES
MAALLGLVLLIYFTSISAAQTTDCEHLREQCINAANGCEGVWNVMEDVCNISGNRCKAEDAVGCNRIIQVLADEYPVFKNCVCTTDGFCSITTLLEKQCSINKEYLDTSSRSDTELSFRQHRTPKDQKHPDELETDCSTAKQSCREDPYCFLAFKNFQRVCQAEVAKCRLQMATQQCLSAWKELRKTVLGKCKCSEPLQKRCVKIWKGIFNNPCLQYSQENQASASSEEEEDDDDNDDYEEEEEEGEESQDTDTDNVSMEAKLQWNLSALSKQEYRANRTCLDVNKECVEDEVCNKQLSLYLKVCSVNKKCNIKECQAAIRFFYQNMPSEVAQTMTFCDCIQPDESCHRAKELLHGKSCAVTAVPTPSCLNVIHMCEENELCRKKYKTFLSKCWRHVTKKCYDDEACLETLIKDDIPCSANTDCKAAYISTWGTMLRVECTCHNSPSLEQSLCKLFHHMLHSKSCFSELRQISIKKKDFHWVNTEIPGEKLSRAQLHFSSINGEAVYIIAYSSCIVLILGIVLLTLLKIRACRTKYESRSPSPDHSSETFMVHYKSHR